MGKALFLFTKNRLFKPVFEFDYKKYYNLEYYNLEYYSSICLPKKLAAAEISFFSVSFAVFFSSLQRNMTAPQTSPEDIIVPTERAALSTPSMG